MEKEQIKPNGVGYTDAGEYLVISKI